MRSLPTKCVAVAALAAAVLPGQAGRPGKNTVMLRGQPQDVYYYPAQDRRAGAVLFLPGDGGWRGFAVDIAAAAAARGYDVYGWDTRTYLSGFTSGKVTLTEAQVVADMRAMAVAVRPGGEERIIISGWSEGAGLALLGASAPQNQSVFRGLLAVGLPDRAFLGWRLADSVTYLTKRNPNEPDFDCLPLLPKVSPLPLAMIQSSGDEYVTMALARKMFDAAAEPKRFFPVEARNHRYDGSQQAFFRVLGEALGWISANH
ncbi:MAG: alpha/beta fold hydrolase [Bryobacterales bacterium]|nr:alpha/beta fold hydrolase [Bryobacterales bacterium]